MALVAKPRNLCCSVITDQGIDAPPGEPLRRAVADLSGGQASRRSVSPMGECLRSECVFVVIDAGPADGTVVVLLHGFPEQNTMWQSIIPQLTAQGYR